MGQGDSASVLTQAKVWKMREYWMYSPFFILHDWAKRSAEARSFHCAVLPKTKPARFLNCTPFVRQVWYNTCTKEWGVFSMPKGVPNKRYTPEFKKLVVETMQEEKLSYSETCRRFEVNSRDRIKSWERIYLEEGAEGLAIERRGRCSKGRPPKQLPKQVEEDLLAEVQRLRAENDYLKNLQALVLEDERRQHKKRW